MEEGASEEAEEVVVTVVEGPGTAGVDGENHIQDHMGAHHTVEITEGIMAIELPVQMDLDLVGTKSAEHLILLTKILLSNKSLLELY